VTAWQAERRRAQSSKFQSENARALANLIGAVGDAGDYVEGIDEKKRKREQEDADRTAKTAERESLMSSRDKGAEASLLRAQGMNDASMMRAKADVDEAEAKRKMEADKAERDSKVLREKSSMDVLRAAARDPSASVETLIGRAVADPELGNLDDTAVAGIMAEERAKVAADAAKTGATEALETQRKAAAKKAARPPKGPSPEAVEERSLRLKKLRAEVDKLTNGATSGKPMSPSDIADLTNERVTIDSLAAIREMAKDPEIMTGSIRGRIENKLASVADSAKWTKFTTAVQIANKLIARAVEGGRMTDADGKFYQEILANPERGPGQFNGILDLMEQLSSDTLTAKLTALGESGYLVPESVKSKPAPAAASAPAASAKVRVSNGQEILEIDKADLGDALADGYKVVR